MRQLYLAATGQNRGKTTASLGLFDGFEQAGLQDRVHEAGRPADGHRPRPAGRRGRRPHARGVRPRRRLRQHEPGPHPARVHEEVHRGRGGRGPRGADPGRPRHVPDRQRHAPDRGHRARRRRCGHRPVERGRGRDARGAGDHRQRGRRRPADRRDRPERLALHGPRRAGRGRDRQQGRSRRPARDRRGPRARPRPPRHPPARRPAGPADPLEPDPRAWSSRAWAARRSTPGRTWTG